MNIYSPDFLEVASWNISVTLLVWFITIAVRMGSCVRNNDEKIWWSTSVYSNSWIGIGWCASGSSRVVFFWKENDQTPQWRGFFGVEWLSEIGCDFQLLTPHIPHILDSIQHFHLWVLNTKIKNHSFIFSTGKASWKQSQWPSRF